MSTIFLDNQYLKVSPKIIASFTPGHFKAKGVFETMLSLDGIVLDQELHDQRLRKGLKSLGIKQPIIKPSLLPTLLKMNQLQVARVRLMVWQVGKEVHTLGVALPYKTPGIKKMRVCLIKTDRKANGRLADVKSLDYELFAQAHAKAQAQGFDEALLLNNRGYIFEASRANVFWTKDKVLYTPPLSSGCLNGITRQQVIKQAKLFKIPVKEINLTPSMLNKAGNAFLTNSLIGIKPIEINILKRR